MLLNSKSHIDRRGGEVNVIKVSKGAKIRNRYNQAPHLIPGYQWESDKLTVRHDKREPRGQPFPSR